MSKLETKIGKWNEVDSQSENLRICWGACYNFCFLLKYWPRQKWRKMTQKLRGEPVIHVISLTGLLSKSDSLFFSLLLLRSAPSSPDVKVRHPSSFYTSRLRRLMQPETDRETIQSAGWNVILSNLHDFSFQEIKKNKIIKINKGRSGQVKHMLRGNNFPGEAYLKRL